mmetsp:Transcript_29940/g.75434  ORF Transcript_29940/g.75434 Transcript_29940/m.75434 type:complete len:317 (-) Transcript_29940:241-1191(-)
MAQPELEHTRLVDHGLVVGGIRIAPDNCRPREDGTPRCGACLQRYVLCQPLVLPRLAGGAIARDEHTVDLAPAPRPHPASLASVAHLQLSPELVERAHRRDAEEAASGGEETQVRVPEFVDRCQQLLEALDAAHGLLLIPEELNTHQSVQGCLISSSGHLLAGNLLPNPVHQRHWVSLSALLRGRLDLCRLKPPLNLLGQVLDLDLSLAEFDLMLLLLHAVRRGERLYDSKAPHDAIRRNTTQHALRLAGGMAEEGPSLAEEVGVLTGHLDAEGGLGVPLEELQRSREEQRPGNETCEEPENEKVGHRCAPGADVL